MCTILLNGVSQQDPNSIKIAENYNYPKPYKLLFFTFTGLGFPMITVIMGYNNKILKLYDTGYDLSICSLEYSQQCALCKVKPDQL